MSRIYPDVTNVRVSGDLLQKIRPSEIVPKQACVCGYRYKTTQVWVLVGLLLLSSFSLVGTIFMWFTSSFDNLVLNSLVLRNNSEALDLFQNPVTSAFVKVYIFNYTNYEAFENGESDRLKVKEIGPYVYERFLERVNVEINENGTLSYQERNTFNFRADLSKGRRQSDKLNIPNIPMMAAAAQGRKTSPVEQWGFSQFLKFTRSDPFKTVPADRFIWGYHDDLFNIAKLINPMPIKEFGILAGKNGTSPDVVTIHNGETGFDKYGYVSAYNGDTEVPHWSTSECRKIEGSDGSLFPPFHVRAKKPVFWYAKDFCRRMPMEFEKEVKIFNKTINAFRYVIPKNVFDDPDRNFENQCYCDLDSSTCAPRGVFNTTPCSFEAPAFLSFPHFYLADPKLQNAIDGLNPIPHMHESYINLHPKLGFLLGGQTRIQINVQVKKSFGITQLKRFEDDMMLPVAWMEVGIDDNALPERAVDLVYQSTHMVQGYELAFKYGFLLTHVITLVFIAALIRGKFYREMVLKKQSAQEGRLLA